VFQIIFKAQSAAEMATLPKLLQLEILSEFNFLPEDLDKADPEKFGQLEHEGRKLFRYRTKEYRIYFERKDTGLIIYRVLHKNSLKDFLYRTRLSTREDEQLQKNAKFWELIDGREK
jgi:mRNA-degrading endonuclease RelE of RelBE toxin-antitoxin system